MGSLDHPNLVKYLFFGSKVGGRLDLDTPLCALDGEEVFMALEYMPGGTLKNLIARQMQNHSKRLYDWNDAFRWFRGIAEGLKYLHGQDQVLVHRDLKPCNILFTCTRVHKEAEAKIADFGLTRFMDTQEGTKTGFFGTPTKPSRSLLEQLANIKGDKTLSKTQHMLLETKMLGSTGGYRAVDATGNTGSLLYMAPEVFKSEDYTEKVDVFSFGVMLYETLKATLASALMNTGEMKECMRYADKVSKGFRRPIPEAWPGEVQELIRICWEQDPRRRPSMGRVAVIMEMMVEEGIPEAYEAQIKRPVKSGGGLFGCFA